MLARLQKSMKEKDQGFTLIELLVVIVIIGILAAIAIPLFLNQRKKGVDASIKSDLKSLATLEETYIVDNPSTQGLDVAVTTGPTAVTVGTGNTFKPTAGNLVQVTLNAATVGGYCITGWNPGSSKGVTAAGVGAGDKFYYNSATGGLLPSTATAC